MIQNEQQQTIEQEQQSHSQQSQRPRQSIRPERWKEFQYQNHSLTINASDVAACIGYNEYKSCPELMFQHVYHGLYGQLLLQHDSKLLGLQLVSEEQQVLDIAKQAGVETTKALQHALQIKSGVKKVESIESAKEIQKHILETARISQKLSKQQLDTLEEKTRQSIDMGCGHTWEDEALNRYEILCGWDVRERNAECRVWHFEPVDTISKEDDISLSLQPVGPAYALAYSSRRRKRKSTADDTDSNDQSKSEDDEETDLIDLTKDENSDGIGEDIDLNCTNDISTTQKPTYFLTIKGMVDGIRDELVEGKDDDDDSWILHRVVVECKHRMRTLLTFPRFYECIQAVIYCQMYNATEADIIQVLRTKGIQNASDCDENDEKKADKPIDEQTTNPESLLQANRVTKPLSTATSGIAKLTEYFEKIPSSKLNKYPEKTNADSDLQKENQRIAQEAIIDGKEQNLKNSTKVYEQPEKREAEYKQTNISRKTETSIEIAVNRISLNDHFQHLTNWKAICLPRLRQWTEGVYNIRRSDELRYRLLSSIAMSQSVENSSQRRIHMQTAWDIVFDQCDFLRDGYSIESYRRRDL